MRESRSAIQAERQWIYERIEYGRVGGVRIEVWLCSTKFREFVDVDRPDVHKETSRKGNCARPGSMSTSRCGEACIAAINTSPVRSPLRRRNSSAEMITTSSRP